MVVGSSTRISGTTFSDLLGLGSSVTLIWIIGIIWSPSSLVLILLVDGLIIAFSWRRLFLSLMSLQRNFFEGLSIPNFGTHYRGSLIFFAIKLITCIHAQLRTPKKSKGIIIATVLENPKKFSVDKKQMPQLRRLYSFLCLLLYAKQESVSEKEASVLFLKIIFLRAERATGVGENGQSKDSTML